MGIDDILNQAAADMWAIVGVEATFHPADGLPVVCLVEIVRDVELQPDSYTAVIVERGTTIEAMVVDVGEPRHGDIFDIGATSFTVRQVVENDGQFVRVVVNENRV